MSSTCEKCDFQISPLIQTVTAGSKCAECFRYRYNAAETAFLYLITNQKLNIHKIGIGIAGVQNSKLEEFINSGYQVYGIWHATDKRKTYNWEQQVFKAIKAKLLSKDDNQPDPMGAWVQNWSESIDASAISLLEIERIIQNTVNN